MPEGGHTINKQSIYFVGCLSMRFLTPLRSELDFDLYVESLNNESFIERKWLEIRVITKLPNSM
jgi:hypothetical protein